MKKKAIIAVLLAAVGVMLLAGCTKEHTHTYAEYGYDGEQHWQYCKEDSKIAGGSYAEHTFTNGSCVCGATFSEKIPFTEGAVSTLVLDHGEIRRDGLAIYTTIYYPGVQKHQYPTIIMSHGFNGTSSRFDGDARFFAEQGFVVVTFDFCGGGTKSRSEGTIQAASVLTESEDLNAVIDYMKSEDYVDTNNLFLFGQSQGGYVSAYTAAQRVDEVKGLMLFFPALCISDDVLSKYSLEEINALDDEAEIQWMSLMVGKAYLADPVSVDIYAVLKQYTKEVIICHGDKDTTVDLSYSQKATDPAQGFLNATLYTMEGQGHGFSGAVRETANQYLLEYIRNQMSK